MGQITTTQNLVAIKEVRHAGQWLYGEVSLTGISCFSREILLYRQFRQIMGAVWMVNESDDRAKSHVKNKKSA